MKISEVQTYLNAEVLTGEDLLDEVVVYCYSCDLMSDVLTFVKNDVLLLTGLVHPQVIRTAELLDINAIVIVRGKVPNDEVLEMAKERNIAVLTTKHSLFTSSGLLYSYGLIGEEIAQDEVTF